MSKLILTRHGQSTWNAENKFTGWVDVDLSEKGILEAQTSGKLIKNLNINKRPISAVADNYEVRNAKTISISINKRVKFNLLYDSNRSLQKKIKIEQIRKETN